MKWLSGVRDFRAVWRFWRFLRREDFAIIHQHSGGRSIRWIARRATRTSIIVHLHGRVCEARGPTLVTPKLWGADAVIAVSNAVARQAVNVRPHLVYPAVHTENNSRVELSALKAMAGRIVGTACRLVEIKGIAYLLHVMAKLHAEFPDLHLEIAGSGPLRWQLEKLAQMLGVADNVTFLGWQTDSRLSYTMGCIRVAISRRRLSRGRA